MSFLLDALKELFSRRSNIVLFALLSVAIFCLFIFLPVWTTPGNDLLFQLSLFQPSAYLLMGCLSLGNAYLLTLQREIRKRAGGGRREEVGGKEVGGKEGGGGKAAASGVGIITSSVFATIGCAACYSSFLSLFGLGGSLFIVEHRWWFAAVAFGLTALGIYHSSRRLTDACMRCAA
ncbi:hypothetical protein HYV73_04205 [Candidatus Uhrbacteria bacterium]|nr:hypothetical protein [Candidatus Uhrbacteria bacterium]